AKSTGNEQLTCLHVAAANGKYVVVDYLLKEYACLFPDTRKVYARTPLHEAALYGHLDVVVVLLAHGALVSPHTTRGRTPLMYAARGGYLGVMECLLDAGANIDEQSETGLTALYEAAKHGQLQAVKFLLKHDANVAISSHTKHSPLHVAIGEGHVEVADALICAGADPKAKDSMGVTVWHEAAGTSADTSLAMVALLQRHHVSLDLDLVDVVMARHPFHYAAVEGHDTFVKALLDTKLVKNVNMQDIDGCTALYYAAANGHDKVVAILLSADADPNLSSIRRSPLHCAVSWQRNKCVELLLAHGAKLDVVDLDGLTPLQVAIKSNFDSIVNLLQLASTRKDAP
ncbi:ankyrin, partial [Thraustotheca clavata]